MLSLLKKKELIDETVVENILSWTHSGFSVWADDAVSPLARKEASRTSAALIKKIYEVDPLVCKKCGGTMKTIAFVQDPHEVKGLLLSLRLPDFHPPPPINAPRSEEPVFETLFDDFESLVQ